MQMVPIIPALAFLLLNVLHMSPPSFVVAKEYHYHVWGHLFCDGNPWPDQKIDLYDEDCFTGDDHMGSAETDKEGRFDLRGSEDDLGTDYPRPYLFIDKTNCHGNPEMQLSSTGHGVSIANKDMYFSNRVYLIRKQEEHNIQIYMSAKRTYSRFENNGSAYPYCFWKCAGMGLWIQYDNHPAICDE